MHDSYTSTYYTLNSIACSIVNGPAEPPLSISLHVQLNLLAHVINTLFTALLALFLHRSDLLKIWSIKSVVCSIL